MDRVFQQMDEWYRDYGQALLAAERLLLESCLIDSSGFVLLQVGGPNDYPLVIKPQFDSYCRLSPERKPHFHGPSLSCDWHDLPFLPNTIDGVLLVHALELTRAPQLLLDEIYRILVGEGRLFLLCFNPWSLFGINKFFSQRDGWPWLGKYYSAYKVRHWLQEAGFNLVDYKSIFFRPACRSDHCLNSFRWLEPAGQLLWPYFGAVNLLVAKKTVLKKSPIKEREAGRIRLGAHVLETSTRNV